MTRRLALHILILGFFLILLYILSSQFNFRKQITLTNILDRPSTRFAIIGDFGHENRIEEQVAALVKGWSPDFIVTTGDNNYVEGSALTIDKNVGQYYSEYIFPYNGIYKKPSKDENRFFPSLGNHDYQTVGAKPYLDYFTLPGNERYYDIVKNPIHLFIINSNPDEQDGVTWSSIQGSWLKAKLKESKEKYKVVIFHHSPYSSGSVHGSAEFMRWPFKEWGATIVVTGHEHFYERLSINDFTYIINGLGGSPSIYPFGKKTVGSLVQYNQAHGAMLVEANDKQINFSFYDIDGSLIDSYTIALITAL